MRNGRSVLKLLALIFLAAGTALMAAGGSASAFFSEAWLYTAVMGVIGFVFLCIGGILFCIHRVRAVRKQDLIDAGKFVYAQIIDIDVNPYQEIQVDRISMNPFFLTCRYIDMSGIEYRFKSEPLLYNPSGLMQSDQLKVYVDLARPGRYYVDTNEILPEDAVLHKFKFDSEQNAQRLFRTEKYITAVTCGVELIGRIKVNGIFKPGFLKLPESFARQFSIALDDRNRAYMGYTILCKYQEPGGVIHIFASRGIWGEPDSSHIGEQVKVYYDGNNYKKYHVDADALLNNIKTKNL